MLKKLTAGVNVINAVWLSNEAEVLVTIKVADGHFVDAIGHFSFGYKDSNNNGRGFYFWEDAIYINNYDCDNIDNTFLRNNPYTSIWPYDASVRPPIGTTVGIWIAIYWDCDEDGDCCHTDVYYPSTVTANNCG
ncbi:hypothetical protein RclHR1_03860017 [Rhizophagus clarus]|uniref:Uncharacterized protein n=1 Tax=Rhizophagus clarus TaxID=94130 RepID=A0A2Z6RVB9_9GLOM|nr:hypothetical protein RclHR1_03860017 [Rhizophagus clarus]